MRTYPTLHPSSLLAQLAQSEPLRPAERGLARHIQLEKRDGQTGKTTPVTATIVAIDNGNDALKGALLHASAHTLITRRIITAYAPASVLRAGEGITTWQVNESEPFWLGEDALLAEKAESLPIGMTEERVPDERYRRFLFACLVELLREAGYEQPGREWQGEHALYLGFGVPNEEVTRAGVKESVQQALRPLFNTAHTVRGVDEQGRATIWQIRLMEVNAYPQTFGSFVTWYYTFDGAAIETDIVKFVALDIGGGQTHTCTVSIEQQASGKPRLRMEAKLLDEGTIPLARALREQLRAHYPGLRLSDVEAQQALVSRTTIIEGRRTRIDELVDESIRSRSQRLLTHLRHLLQEDRTFLMFTGGGAILLEELLRTLVCARRSSQSFLFVPQEWSSVLNAIGGYVLAQTRAHKRAASTEGQR